MINDYADINREIGQYDTNKDRLFLLPKNPMVSVFAEEFNKCCIWMWIMITDLLRFWIFPICFFFKLLTLRILLRKCNWDKMLDWLMAYWNPDLFMSNNLGSLILKLSPVESNISLIMWVWRNADESFLSVPIKDQDQTIKVDWWVQHILHCLIIKLIDYLLS